MHCDRIFTDVHHLPAVQFSSVRYTLKTYVLRGSGVGLGEEVGLQPPSKLSTTDGSRAQLSWQRVPDNWGSDVEAPLYSD